MFKKVISSLHWGAMMALAFGGLGLGAPLSSAQTVDRPQVEPSSEIERLRWSLEAQKKQLDEYRSSMSKYTRWFAMESRVIKRLKSAYSSAQRAVGSARRGWNTRINPTCETGQTYATCSCGSGRIGKARWLDVIRRAKARAAKARKARNAAIRAYNTNVAKADLLTGLYNRAHETYRQGKATLARMKASQGGVRKAPDSLGEILKRSAEENPTQP